MADAIELRGLTRCFGKRCVLNQVTLKIPTGSIYGLLGRNGAGKTTLIKTLLGFLRPTRGEVRVLGCPAEELTPALRERIGYLVEGHRLDHGLTIRQLQRFTRPFYRRWSDAAAARMLDHFGLDPARRVGTLSKGQQAQVALLLTLATEPELLVMDDPTLGLDPAVRREFLESMIAVLQQEGRTVLFSSHILTDVERVADRIGIIENGELLVDGPLETLKERVRLVRLEFDGAPPALDGFPGLLAARRDGPALELTVTRFGPEAEARLAALRPRSIEASELNLEEIFLAYTVGYRQLTTSHYPPIGKGEAACSPRS